MIMFGTPVIRRSKRLSTSLSTENAMRTTPMYSHCKGRGGGRQSLGPLNNDTYDNDIYEASSPASKASTTKKSPLAAGKENGNDSDDLYKSPSTPQSGNDDSISIYASDVSLLAQGKGLNLVSSPAFQLSASARALFDSYDEADDGSIKNDGKHVAAKVKDTADSVSVVESAMVDKDKEENNEECVLIASNKVAVKVEDSDDALLDTGYSYCDDSLEPIEQTQLMSSSKAADSRDDDNDQSKPVLSSLKGGMIAAISAMEVLEGEFGGDITAMLSKYAELSLKNEDLEANVAHLTNLEAKVVQEAANHSVVCELDKCKSKLKPMEEEVLDGATKLKELTEEKHSLLKEKEEWIAEKAVIEEQHHAAQDEIRSLEGAKEEASAKYATLEAALIQCTGEKEALLSENADLKSQVDEKEILRIEKEEVIAKSAKLEAALVELTRGNQALSSENADLKTMVDQLGCQLKVAESALASRATQAEIEALETEKEVANTKSTELQAALIKCTGEKEALLSENADLKSQVDEVNGKLGTTVAECHGYKTELEALINKEKVDANDKLAALSEEIDALKENLAEIQAEKSTLDLCLNGHFVDNADLKSQLDSTNGKLSTAEAECAGCKTELEELAKEKVDAQGKLAALEQEITVVKAEKDRAIQKAINEQKKLHNSTKESESLKISLRMSKRECVRLKEELTQRKAKSDSLIDQVDKLQIDLVQWNVELAAVREENEEKTSIINAVREEKHVLEQDCEDMRSIITALERS